MDTETLRPSGAGSETNLHIGGSPPAPTNWQSVDEVVTDEEVTTVDRYYNETTYARDLYNIGDSGVGAGTINSVTVWIRAMTPSLGGKAKESIRSGGVTQDGGEISLTTSFANYSNIWATPPEGGSWDWDKINALQAGVNLKGGGTLPQSAVCTQVWVVVDYTPVPPGWTGKISGVTNPAKVMGVLRANIAKVKGVS